ncbi:MAG: sigma-70 family RNA polymerase sigma factor [Bacteroidota bacterium]
MTPEEREQKYRELLKRHEQDINAVVEQYRKWNWRLEYDDLRQEVMLQLWQVLDRVLAAQEPKAYIKRLAARTIADYVERFKRDALYDASPIDAVCPEGESDTDDAEYRPGRIVFPVPHDRAPSASWEKDPPLKCHVKWCKATEFQLVYDKRGRPWWQCTNGHRTFGYRRTEEAVYAALRLYHTLRDHCVRSSWLAPTGGKGASRYPVWERNVEVKADIDRALEALPRRQRQIVGLHLIYHKTAQETHVLLGVDERTVKRVCRQAVVAMAQFLGPEWL